MKKYLIVFVILILLCGCATSGSKLGGDYNQVFSEYEKYEGSVYMGISGPYTDKDKAFAVALENAATMASLAQHLVIRSDADLIMKSTEYTDKERFNTYSKAIYDAKLIEQIIANMEIKELRWIGEEIGAIAFIEYGNKDRVEWNHSNSWLKDGIKIPGYITAIGIAEEYYYIQDSIEAAAFEGAISLLDFHDGTVSAVSEHVDTFNESMNVDSYQINMNFLNGFTVLDYYYDPGKRVFYSLVAVKE